MGRPPEGRNLLLAPLLAAFARKLALSEAEGWTVDSCWKINLAAMVREWRDRSFCTEK